MTTTTLRYSVSRRYICAYGTGNATYWVHDKAGRYVKHPNGKPAVFATKAEAWAYADKLNAT